MRIFKVGPLKPKKGTEIKSQNLTDELAEQKKQVKILRFVDQGGPSSESDKPTILCMGGDKNSKSESSRSRKSSTGSASSSPASSRSSKKSPFSLLAPRSSKSKKSTSTSTVPETSRSSNVKLITPESPRDARSDNEMVLFDILKNRNIEGQGKLMRNVTTHFNHAISYGEIPLIESVYNTDMIEMATKKLFKRVVTKARLIGTRSVRETSVILPDGSIDKYNVATNMGNNELDLFNYDWDTLWKPEYATAKVLEEEPDFDLGLFDERRSAISTESESTTESTFTDKKKATCFCC